MQFSPASYFFSVLGTVIFPTLYVYYSIPLAYGFSFSVKYQILHQHKATQKVMLYSFT